MAATTIPFVPPIEVTYGEATRLSPLVRRVVAENPSKYTYMGTGTYIVGRGDVAVVDPGPALDAHRDALATVLAGERVQAILVTHCHADHSPLSAWLRDETGAPTYAFGPHGEVEQLDDEMKPEEAIDVAFVPDVVVPDGAVVEGPGWTFEAVHTPGHTSNHTCFALHEERTLFTGDHVMGWSTTVITPPDGDMRAYCASLEKLLRRDDAIYRPTHGGPITEPRPFVEAYLAHRLEREVGLDERTRLGDRAAVRRPVDRVVPPEELLERRAVRAHVAVGRGDDRRAPAHHVVAGEQRPLLV